MSMMLTRGVQHSFRITTCLMIIAVAGCGTSDLPLAEPLCGDQACNGDETCATCAEDCGACTAPFCGDKACNGKENCLTCTLDCDVCPACGGPGRACCGGNACSEGYTCTNSICQANACGGSGQACCNGTSCNSGLTCTNSICQAGPTCGASGQACCAGDKCNSGLSCNSSKVCEASSPSCGASGQACCTGDKCNSGLTCNGSKVCQSGPSCGDKICNSTETCATCAGDCGACKKTGEPCTSSGECQGGLCYDEASTGHPKGYCSASCSKAGDPCPGGGRCTLTYSGSLSCLAGCTCSSGQCSGCRPGYLCGSTDQEHFYGCVARCELDSHCSSGSCNLWSGLCGSKNNMRHKTGTPCTSDTDCEGLLCGTAENGFPGGYCSGICNLNGLKECGSTSGVCVNDLGTAEDGLCSQGCADSLDCRPDYECALVAGATAKVCVPQ